MENQELEVKLHVSDLEAVKKKLTALGASIKQARTHEMNLRFDTADGELTRNYKALRLRSDTAARLTYKGPSSSVDGVRVRQEIEFQVSNFNAARAFLDALGYQVAMIYEKQRAEYYLEGTSISLDELPYGDFVEVEGDDTQRIRQVSDLLGLKWENRVFESYVVLFNRLRSEYGLEFRDLIFDNFEGLTLSLDKLGIKAADS